jgi:hypothetical protein
MKRQALLWSVAVLVAACVETPSSAPRAPSESARRIINGAPTGSNLYTGVGALLFDFDNNGLTGDDEWCTGSLIAPTIFLTAAHCVVSSFTPPGSQFYVSFAADLLANGATFVAPVGVVPDPLFGKQQGHDHALIFLPERATRGLETYALPRENELDLLSAHGDLARATFINVGYGTSVTRTGKPSFASSSLRQWSTSEFSNLQKLWLQLLMNTNAVSGGDCYGDSGGPKFLETNPGVIYATVTTGDLNCRATSLDYRTDTKTARAFLGQFVPLP